MDPIQKLGQMIALNINAEISFGEGERIVELVLKELRYAATAEMCKLAANKVWQSWGSHLTNEEVEMTFQAVIEEMLK